MFPNWTGMVASTVCHLKVNLTISSGPEANCKCNCKGYVVKPLLINQSFDQWFESCHGRSIGECIETPNIFADKILKKDL